MGLKVVEDAQVGKKSGLTQTIHLQQRRTLTVNKYGLRQQTIE